MSDKFEFVTHKASTQYKELGWKTPQFKALVSCLDVARHFRGTRHNMQSSIGLISVDSYRIMFDEVALKEDRRYGLEFYLKLAIDPDEPGTVVISFHLSS